MTSKVKPSEKNLENLRKAEQAWLGGGIDDDKKNVNTKKNKSKTKKNETEKEKKTCKEKIYDRLPHGFWFMIIYRIGIFLALILYINLKMGNDFIYEASEKFRTIVTDENLSLLLIFSYQWF